MTSHAPSPARQKQRARRPTRNGGEQMFSRTLSYVLRHGAVDLRLPLDAAGYVPVASLRANVRGLESLTDDALRRVVKDNDKNRFGLRTDENGQLNVRANQGHSGAVAARIDRGELLQPLSIDKLQAVCVHGTTLDAWLGIMKTGLSKMQRDMIHFAMGLPGDDGVVSGMRSGSVVLIFVDLHAVMEDNVRFYCSENGVLLTAGVGESGILPTKYFEKVVRRDTGETLMSRGRLTQGAAEG